MSAWEDRCYPTDFYARAQQIAKSYCKRYPDADRELVYYAAAEAAEQYERSEELRKHKLKNIVNLRIVHALHARGKKEDKMAGKPDKNMDAMIADYNNGMTYSEIADRYGKAYNTVCNQFVNWSKKGLVTLRGKKTPASAEPTQATKDDIAKTADIVPPTAPIVNTVPSEQTETPQVDMVDWLAEMIDMAHAHVDGFCGNYKFTYANAASNNATVKFTVDGTNYRLNLEVLK